MKRVSNNIIKTRLFAILFAITFIASFFMGLNAYADTNVFKISNVIIADKSSTVSGSITDIENDEVDNNFVFHKLNDYVVYKIDLQNIKGNNLTILSITDDNNSPYIVYEYDKHENETIKDGKTINLVIKAIYKNEVTDISKRNQSNNVKFTINFLDNGKQDSSTITINPKTGDKINISMAILIISSIGFLLSFLFEKHKKISKSLIVIGLLFIPFVIKAASFVYNINLVSEYKLYDKEVVTIVIGDEKSTQVVSYNDYVSEPTAPAKVGRNFIGWVDENGNDFDFSSPITGDTKIIAKYQAIGYDINYNLNGGNATNPTKYTIDDEITLNNPTLNGYTFTGWTGTDLTEPTKNVTFKNKTGNRSYEAHYEVTTNRINYSGITNEYAASIGNPLTYTIEDSDITLHNPTKEGYTFTGWTGSNGNTPQMSVVIPSGSYGDKNYTANFSINSYTLDVNPNGGTFENSTGITQKTNEYNSVIVLSEPTKEGYEFTGWTLTGTGTLSGSSYTYGAGNGTVTANYSIIDYEIKYYGLTTEEEASLTNPDTYTIEDSTITLNNPSDRIDNDGDVYERFIGWTYGDSTSTTATIPAGSTGKKEFTATFVHVDPDTYTITYDLNDGILSESNPTSYTIKTPTFTLSNPTKNGYDFAGWTGTGLSGPTMTVTIANRSTGDRTYTATYSTIDYNINYILNGGNPSTSNPTQYTIETNTFTLNNPAKNGYNFTGWTGSNGTNPELSVSVQKGTTGELTYTANYSIIDYDITYTGLDGATVNPSNPTTYNIESGVIVLTNPTKVGYDFTGWSGTGLTGNDNFNVTIPANSTEDRSYEAHFTPTTYNITYDLHDGIASPANPTTYNIESNVITLTNPTKAGYDFTGWSGTGLTGNDNMNVTIPANSTGDRSYEAHYSLIDYSIAYELNGGSVSGTNPTTYNVESSTITLINPSKAGYTFIGWSGTDLTGNNNTTVTIPSGSTGDRSYEAHFSTEQFTITYDLDGGNANPTNPTTYTSESSAITLTNPTKAGYNFTGWSGTDLTGNNNMTVTIPAGSTGNKSYTAHYSLITYNIGYTLNGGSVSGNPTTYDVTTGVIVLNNPTKTGYTFTGWSGTGLTGNNNTTVTIPSGAIGDRSYEAHFSLDNYTIGYELNGGTASGNPTIYSITSSSITLNNPSKEGYNFTGWSGTDLTGNNNMNVTIPTGSTGNRSYTAHYSIENYTIGYTLNGGTVSGTNPTTYNVETGIITLINPTKTGYTFTGWSGTGLTGNDNTTVIIDSGATGDRSYEAHFTANKYYVAFNSNASDATGTMSNQEFTYDVTDALTSNAYSRNGYIFDGWNTDPDGLGDPYSDEANITNLLTSGTITLYAQWLEDKVTVTYDVNGGNSLQPSESPIQIFRNTPIGTLPTVTHPDSTKVFVGWFINMSDSTPIDGTYAPSTDVTITAKWRNATDVCEMNGVYYATVQDAVNAAPASETSNPADAPQVTINLIADIDMGRSQDYVLNMYAETNSNHLKNIIFDMHNHYIKQPSNVNNNKYIMRTRGILEMKNGTIVMYSNKGAVEADGNKAVLTLTNMNIEGKIRQAVYNDGGTIYINGGEYIANAPYDATWKRGAVHTVNNGTTYILEATITNTNATGWGVSAESGTTIIGTKDDAYDTSKIKITGTEYGIRATSNVKIYDGIILCTSSPVINDENYIIDHEDGYVIEHDNDGTYNRAYYILDN